jgi:hypothetical protein
MKVSRIAKIAGASLAGFCAVSLAADKVNVAPMLSQAAGFVGAFLGSLVASRRTGEAGQGSGPATPAHTDSTVPPVANPELRPLTQVDQPKSTS